MTIDFIGSHIVVKVDSQLSSMTLGQPKGLKGDLHGVSHAQNNPHLRG